ncbi:MAG: tRNA 2-selenouridine(34) synthase MnmH [Bacteroidia bacterium]
MPTVAPIQEFITLAQQGNVVVDVRTPSEFEQGHIPNAINIPLFTNEERIVVGTLYKQQGKQPAILKGLEFVGPKMADIIVKVKALVKNNTVLVHCWRGGMRSGSVAWLLETYGFKVYTLKGGYKSFRNFALSTFKREYNLQILGGKTGSAKTEILQQLILLNQQVIDLEKLASHKGSAFGSLGENKQPTQEQFENTLAINLQMLDATTPIWLEDESRLIGNKVIPEGLWNQMRAAKTICIDVSFSERVTYLTKEYGKFSIEQLRDSIGKITKRLGHLQTKNALLALDTNDLETTCQICLGYYDKSYNHGVEQREPNTVTHLSFEKLDTTHIAKELITHL